MFRALLNGLFGLRHLGKDATNIQMPRIPPPKFAEHSPSRQGAIDIFQGHWATDISDVVPGVLSGTTRLFTDPRTRFPLVHFASPSGDLSGQRVLELGPLEGAHTYQLAALGADVVAVEANTEAYLKCLIVKELCKTPRARFLYGDCAQYLRTEGERFDFIFCCGILYHISDPVDFIELMSKRSDRVFVWTHFINSENRADLTPIEVEKGGQKYRYYQRRNIDRASSVFWGGNKSVSSLLSREDILRAFHQYGLTNSFVHEEQLDHPAGPCFSMSFWR